MVEIVEYDEIWEVQAAVARVELLSLEVFEAVEHIGSTSVPGLAAKPVIDLMAAGDLDAVAAREGDLARLGYQRFDTGMPDRLFCFRDENGQRAYQLHVVPAGSWGTNNERLLRDYLRAHPEDARRYGDLKRRLAAEYTDGTEYTRGKTELIQELTDRARAARGLPPSTSGKSKRASRSASYPSTPPRPPAVRTCPLILRRRMVHPPARITGWIGVMG